MEALLSTPVHVVAQTTHPGKSWESGVVPSIRQSVTHEARIERTPIEDSLERRAETAYQKVKLGEVSRARQCLTGAGSFAF